MKYDSSLISSVRTSKKLYFVVYHVLLFHITQPSDFNEISRGPSLLLSIMIPQTLVTVELHQL